MTQIHSGNGIKMTKNQVDMAESYMTTADMLARQNGKPAGIAADSDSFDVAKSIRYDRTSRETTADTVMSNFDEYRRDMQEKAKAEGEDSASEEKERNEQAKEVARNISSQERKLLEQMGIDVESTDLTDLMHWVNNLRSEAHKQELDTLLAMAKVNQGDFSNLMITGAGVSMTGSGVELEGVDVLSISREKAIAEDANQQSELVVSEADFLYLHKNNLSVNQENLYKAHFSGQRVESVGVTEDMEKQLLKVCEQAGFEGDETAFEAAKLLLSNDVPVTTDAIRGYMDFKKYIGFDIQNAPTRDQQLQAVAERQDYMGDVLYQETKQVSTLAVFDMAREGRAITIASAHTYTENHLDRYADAAYVSQQLDRIHPLREQVDSEEGMTAVAVEDLRAVTAMRQMEEIRLMMTQRVAARMMKLDVNIDTRELSQVVAELKQIEYQMTLDTFKNADIVPTEENLKLYEEMQQKVQEISDAPAHNLGFFMRGTSFTVRALHSAITNVEPWREETFDERAQGAAKKVAGAFRGFETIRRSYEALETAPRADMGDSIKKAFENAADMLREMKLPASEENLRAVRILGYNSIEITESNISQIVTYDRQVNDMLDAFYPEAVLAMIKDGINPMDIDIPDLTARIRGKNYNQGVSEAKNFATYLRDMEKQGELTKEQRESYIGVFRMMDKLAKSGDREAGFLFANGNRLTLRNLLAAMRSRRDAGMDISIDDSFGMLQEMETSGKSIDAQIGSAFYQDESESDASGSWQIGMDAVSDQAVMNYMEEMQISMNAINAQATSMLLSENASFYDVVSDVLSKLRFEDHTREDAVDEETGNMSASMSGAEVGAFPWMEDGLIGLLEQLRGREQMALTYESMSAQLTERMYLGALEGRIHSRDLASVKLVQAGFHVLSNMARNDRYQFPVQTEQGVQLVNLSVLHKEGQGSLQIRMQHASYGNLEARMQLSSEGILYGQVVAETSEESAALNLREKEWQDAVGAELLGLEVFGFKGQGFVQVSLGHVFQGAVPEAMHQQAATTDQAGTVTETEDIYKCAIACIRTLNAL